MEKTRIYSDPKFFNIEGILGEFTPSNAQQSDEVVRAIISSDKVSNAILVLSALFIENFYLADEIEIADCRLEIHVNQEGGDRKSKRRDQQSS